MRILHLSDIHVWHYTWNPRQLFSKRSIGMMELLTGRAGRFRLERLDDVIAHANALGADQILITGDITTTALPSEFRVALKHLEPLLQDPQRVTIVPGNHDRYTVGALRDRRFEAAFQTFLPEPTFPWLRRIGDRTAILGLDAARPHLSARGFLPEAQIEAAMPLVGEARRESRELIIASHYPVTAPAAYQRDLSKKRLDNAPRVAEWLRTIGPHLYCCGHVHAAWAFTPPELPQQLCINAGAPLLRDPTGLHPPGFVEITLKAGVVSVTHHAWSGDAWQEISLAQQPLTAADADATLTSS